MGVKAVFVSWRIGVRAELVKDRVAPVVVAFAGRQGPRGHLQGDTGLWPAVFGGVTAHVRGPRPRVRGLISDDAVNGFPLTLSFGVRDLGRFLSQSFPFSARRSAAFGGFAEFLAGIPPACAVCRAGFLTDLHRRETNLLLL